MNTMRKPLKVFLSGPISSRMETYKAEFDDAARIVIEAGHLPLNPATLPIGMESRDYMRICLAMLDSADLLLQLPGWGESTGAIAEHNVAMKTGIESLTLEDFIREYVHRAGATPVRTIRDGAIDLANLKAAIRNGDGPEMIRPHDELDILLDTEKTITVTCGFVNSEMARFIFKDCYDECEMNDDNTNQTGYFGSKGRRHVLEDIYPQFLPQLESDDDTDPFPYIIVRIDSGGIETQTDPHKISVILVIGIFEDSLENEGHESVLEIIERIQQHYEETPALKEFVCADPFNWALQDEPSYPYFYGAVNLVFHAPAPRAKWSELV